MKNYRTKMTKKMKNLRSQSIAEYWQILNQYDHSYQPNIPFSDLIDISKNLNSSVTDNLNEKKYSSAWTTQSQLRLNHKWIYKINKQSIYWVKDFYSTIWTIWKSVTYQRCENRVANMWMDNVTLTFDLQTSISIGFLLSPSGMCTKIHLEPTLRS